MNVKLVPPGQDITCPLSIIMWLCEITDTDQPSPVKPGSRPTGRGDIL